ncbi:PAM68 family protein [Dolichospermum sp. ST_con]|nr:PAM68 family protein [Dolichospermum sp. ST_con]MDD1422653.1 PAM68 family protein [Dolichospermum sp. ST_sed1]MDD1423904.1 PAM68 family protein [Dolichospermum sp. ST_sed9]MDD1434093.1 PAM68 family protein [Dolichospermum sp. ST_sed6]MDD1436485.1 PAM68 family protein [Dolichospermum sp. ST_sed10]MDD1440264.1 PAM68 family protein [Dolichospermum sp. ST_sed3]MDD1448811.1 PAM68 family protein [Dolichospermum sp. ST_sed8]MDD1454342.1 PAM68 family protein [Dolichospermum sp. ST_sed7]MDD145877
MAGEESERSKLPFEPSKKRPKPAKAISQPVIKTAETPEKPQQQRRYSKQEMAIPEVVSQRMIRRVAGFCGIPTVLGISSLVVSYLLVTFAHIELPPIAVLLVNMGLFGLGVVGITYGVLSASWDEERPGTILGADEFSTNWGRMTEVWRDSQKKNV